MSRHPLAAIGQPVIVVDSCTFESGDLTSFSNARSNIILFSFQSVTDVGVHLTVQSLSFKGGLRNLISSASMYLA